MQPPRLRLAPLGRGAPGRGEIRRAEGEFVSFPFVSCCEIGTLCVVGRWKVDPEGLRAAASVFAGVAESNEGETTIAATGDVGDARLVSALSSFMEALIGGWMQRVSQTEGVAQTLTASATLYEASDDDGVHDMERAEHF